MKYLQACGSTVKDGEGRCEDYCLGFDRFRLLAPYQELRFKLMMSSGLPCTILTHLAKNSFRKRDYTVDTRNPA